ncbi:MAG: oxidoreductase, partial [Gammaproteobacteria bacterium]
MDKWNLIINVDRCENCNNCVLAAKDEHVGNEFPGYSAPAAKEGAELITITRKMRGNRPLVDVAYLIKMCNHCDNAPCMKVGGDAIRKRKDGIVI